MGGIRQLSCVVVGFFTLSAPLLAQATTGATFSFTPQASGPLSVPVLSDLALLALGLLLVVVALRTLLARRGAQRFVSLALLCGGLVLGGLGAERVSALIATVFVIGEDPGNLNCAGVSDQAFSLGHSGTATVSNNCSVPGEVSTQYLSFPGNSCILTGGDCGALAAGDSCVLPDEVCPPP